MHLAQRAPVQVGDSRHLDRNALLSLSYIIRERSGLRWKATNCTQRTTETEMPQGQHFLRYYSKSLPRHSNYARYQNGDVFRRRMYLHQIPKHGNSQKQTTTCPERHRSLKQHLKSHYTSRKKARPWKVLRCSEVKCFGSTLDTRLIFGSRVSFVQSCAWEILTIFFALVNQESKLARSNSARPSFDHWRYTHLPSWRWLRTVTCANFNDSEPSSSDGPRCLLVRQEHHSS